MNKVDYSHKPGKSRKVLCFILQALLDDAGINSFEFSKRLGVPYSGIHKMLNRPDYSPSVDSLRTVAQYFNISIEQLIGDKPIDKLKNVKVPTENYVTPTPSNPKYDKPCDYKLLIKCVEMLDNYSINSNKRFNFDKSLRILREIYHFSFVKKLSEPDKDFFEWFIENNA